MWPFIGQCQLLNKRECGHASLQGSESASFSKAGMLTSLMGVSSIHLREHASMLSLCDNVG